MSLTLWGNGWVLDLLIDLLLMTMSPVTMSLWKTSLMLYVRDVFLACCSLNSLLSLFRASCASLLIMPIGMMEEANMAAPWINRAWMFIEVIYWWAERCWISRYSLGMCFGTSPNGEQWKCRKGGCEKGPTILPQVTSWPCDGSRFKICLGPLDVYKRWQLESYEIYAWEIHPGHGFW